jgi:hypothetical protein
MLFVDVLDTEKLKIQCPFCGATLLTPKGLKECPHLLFCCSSESAEVVRGDCPEKFEDETVDEFDDETYDGRSVYERIEALDYPHSFCFWIYNDLPPFMCGSGFEGYIGICQFTEDEMQKLQQRNVRPAEPHTLSGF